MLGINSHIILQTEVCVATQTIPADAWIIGGTKMPRCVDTLCKIYGERPPRIYSISEAKTFEILQKDPATVPWAHVLGVDVIKARIDDLSRQLDLILGKQNRQVYNNMYVDTRNLLNEMSAAKICYETLARFLKEETNSSLRTCLKTFKPNEKGFTSKVEYDQTGTSTGRLVVKNGPSILTLPSRYRGIIKSRYKKGKIISIDFKSLEPRVALSIRKKEAPIDIYTHIAKEILSGKITRSVAKVATIAALYGISFKKFSEMSGCNSRQVLDDVKSFFSVTALSKSLSGDDFKNYWGRPLDQDAPSHVRISHFIQSTSCDTVNVGFWKFVKKMRLDNIELTPLFVLHDALILDVPENNIEKLRDFCKSGLNTPLGKFPVECEYF